MGLKLSDKAKSVIRTVAPTLGASLGGPLGGLAGNVIAAALGDASSKDVEDALLTQKPEALLALRQAERDFELKLEEMGIDRERIAMADRISARDIAKVNMKPQMVLSGVFTVGYFMIFWWLLAENVELNIRQSTMVNVLMGVLTAGVMKIMDFWFGSTAGSTLKSHLLAESKPAETN